MNESPETAKDPKGRFRKRGDTETRGWGPLVTHGEAVIGGLGEFQVLSQEEDKCPHWVP